MAYTKDDVKKIIGEYALGLRERRLQFSGPQREVLEEVLLRELCGVKKEEKQEEKLYGIALMQKMASPPLTILIREHATVLYGLRDSLKKYTEDNLWELYLQATKGIELGRFSKRKTGISGKIPMQVSSLCNLENYFVQRGKTTERPFADLEFRMRLQRNNTLSSVSVVESSEKPKKVEKTKLKIKKTAEKIEKKDEKKYKKKDEEDDTFEEASDVDDEWGWMGDKYK